MANEKVAAFASAEWMEIVEKYEIQAVVGGVGGTGSWLSLFLTRNLINVTAYDDDKVEKRNLGGQFFSEDDIGKPKVNAILTNCNKFSNSYLLRGMQMRIRDNSMLSYAPFYFSCFDKMESRKIFFKHWEDKLSYFKNNPMAIPELSPIFIDLRLELELLQVYAVTEDRIDDYKKTLVDDDETPTVCTLKQTGQNAAMIAGIATDLFLNHLVNIKYKDKVREVSFFTEYYPPLNTFTNAERDH